MIDWEAQNVQIDKLIPPPFGQVVITELGLVLMCRGTYKMLSEGKEYSEVELNDNEEMRDMWQEVSATEK